MAFEGIKTGGRKRKKKPKKKPKKTRNKEEKRNDLLKDERAFQSE